MKHGIPRLITAALMSFAILLVGSILKAVITTLITPYFPYVLIPIFLLTALCYFFIGEIKRDVVKEDEPDDENEIIIDEELENCD